MEGRIVVEYWWCQWCSTTHRAWADAPVRLTCCEPLDVFMASKGEDRWKSYDKSKYYGKCRFCLRWFRKSSRKQSGEFCSDCIVALPQGRVSLPEIQRIYWKSGLARCYVCLRHRFCSSSDKVECCKVAIPRFVRILLCLRRLGLYKDLAQFILRLSIEP